MSLRFVETGELRSEAVVFIHGAGVAGWMWKMQVERLGRFRRIVPDLPDHGASLDRPFPGIAECADEIAELIRTRAGGAAHLVGHSLGAKIVLEILARAPEVARSALVSSALVRKSSLVSMMDSHALNALSLWMLRSPSIARAQASAFGFPDPAMTAAFLEDLGRLRPENLDRPISAFAARLFPPPGLERARDTRVLLTAASREPRAMLGSLADLSALLPTAETAVFEGARHDYPWARHGAYTALLEAWLEGRELPRAVLSSGQ